MTELASPSVQLPSDDEGLSDVAFDGVDSIVLPSDDDGQDGPPPDKKRRHREFLQGPTRQELLLKTTMVPRRVPYLWDARVPVHLQGEPADDIMEIYSPPRVVPVAQEMSLRGGISADLGAGWDFNKEDHRVDFVIQVKARRPQVLVLTPACTLVSKMMNLNWGKLSPTFRVARFRECILHLEFCCLLMDLQSSEGRKVVFEHPEAALSWQSERVQEIMALPGMKRLHFDMCRLGMKSPILGVPLQKPTTIMTNLEELVPKLANLKCKGDHKHKVIRGSEGIFKLSRWAQRYPRGLCEAIATAASEHLGR